MKKNNEAVTKLSSWLGVSACLVNVFPSLPLDSTANLDEYQKWLSHTIPERIEQRLESSSLIVKSDLILSDSGTVSVVAGHIMFDATGVLSILDSERCSSVTDSGDRTFDINFTMPLEDYTFLFYADKQAGIELLKLECQQTSNLLRITTNVPYSGVIRVVFFQSILGLATA